MKTDFTLIDERTLAEVNGRARYYRHVATGAEIVSVCNDDENKCFGVTFRTPPKNSTGVAHILEHSVLCGSDRYPVKEPFLVLLQSSLQSFLNAFTFPDKTCYPVASANLQDFYNLIDVYIDAVFHPLISENIFRQEGWHIEADTPDGPWAYKGVVYNEMKGVYSSPDSRIAEESQHAIFPDTLYSLDSGGNPAEIPSLTYEEFRDFHSRYYHPSNARFFFWGDDPEEERLNIVARALEGQTRCEVDSRIPLQRAFSAPTRIVKPYAAEKDGSCLFTMNWLTGIRGDLERTMILSMLEHILEGMPGSPLRRALISSGLGEDTVGGGLETDLAQTFYSTGLKGIAWDNIPRAEALIQSTLEELARDGIDPSLVEAAVNTVEFAYRESNFGSFPRGLAAMLQSLSTWLYDHDPLASLAWEAPLQHIKDRLARGERVFEEALRTLFLDNPSRATVILQPQTDMAERLAREEAERLAGIQASLDEGKKQEVCTICTELQKAQSTPDSPEALASIPSLGLEDLPAQSRFIRRDVHEDGSLTCVAHEQPTRGIAYLNLLVPMPKLPVRLLPSLNLFLRSFREVGTARHDYTDLGALIDAKTGGLGADTTLVTRKDGEVRCYLSLAGKAVADKTGDLFGLLREMLLEPVTDQSLLGQRLREMLLEDKARLEQGLISSGHAAASLRVRSHYTTDAYMSDLMSGISSLSTIRSRLESWEDAFPRLLEDFEDLRHFLVAARPGYVNCVGEEGQIARVFAEAQSLWASLPRAAAADGSQVLSLASRPAAEVFTSPSQVNYVAKGCNLKQLGYGELHGPVRVIVRHLSRSYLWEQVRVLGGAYGAFCSQELYSGNFVCSSYRDPNVEATLRAYDGIASYLSRISLSKDELTRAIVGTIGDVDAYLLPDARGNVSLLRLLSGISNEELQTQREEILATRVEDFRAFADIMQEVAEKGHVCVIGGARAGEVARSLGWSCTSLF